MYQNYGDRRLIEDYYDSLKKYVEFLRDKAENGLLKYSYYGDWVAIENARGVSSRPFIIITIPRCWPTWHDLINKTADAQAYDKLAGDIKAAFNREFLTRRPGTTARPRPPTRSPSLSAWPPTKNAAPPGASCLMTWSMNTIHI